MVEKGSPGDIKIIGVFKRLNALSLNPVAPAKKKSLLETIPRFKEEAPPVKKTSLLATIPRFPEEEPQPTEEDRIIARSARVFEDLLAVVPVAHRDRYFERLKVDTTKPQQIARLKGIIGELQRVKEYQHHPDVERVDFDAEPINVGYPAYRDRDQWFEIQDPQGQKTRKPSRFIKNGQVEIDVPLRVKGDPSKPYVYEVKEARGIIYGSHPIKRLNQLLKYNAAVEKGLASGATVEVRGRMGTNMLRWFMVGEDLIPNVQVVYTLDLPSGKKYRMVLKPAKNPLLNVASDDKSFKHEHDIKVIAGVKRAFAMEDKTTFIRSLTHFRFDDFENIDFDLHGPERITDPQEMTRYQIAISRKIWERFGAIADAPVESKIYSQLKALSHLSRAIIQIGRDKTIEVMDKLKRRFK